jgi:thiol:disulfide interchange protein DsbA
MRLTHLTLIMLALLPLAACKDKAPAAVADSPSNTPAASEVKTQAASAEDPQRAALAEANVKAAAEAAAKAPPPVEGTDFVTIPNGLPFDTAPGKIEIVEYFGYVCPACAAIEPTVAAMRAKLPPDVHFVPVPAAFGSMWDNYGKAYYAAEAMGLLEKTHEAMFRAIHVDQILKGERGMDTPEEIAAFYKNYGADPGQFLSSMQSFAVAAKLNRARQSMTAAYVNGDQMGTPTFVIDGKYRVKGKTTDDMFRIINQLVVAERAKLAAGTPAPTAAPAAPAATPSEPAKP